MKRRRIIYYCFAALFIMLVGAGSYYFLRNASTWLNAYHTTMNPAQYELYIDYLRGFYKYTIIVLLLYFDIFIFVNLILYKKDKMKQSIFFLLGSSVLSVLFYRILTYVDAELVSLLGCLFIVVSTIYALIKILLYKDIMSPKKN